MLYVIIYRKLRINGEIFMLSDIEIAQNAKMKDISEIASMLGIDAKGIEPIKLKYQMKLLKA